jgi:hypothetical protein
VFFCEILCKCFCRSIIKVILRNARCDNRDNPVYSVKDGDLNNCALVCMVLSDERRQCWGFSRHHTLSTEVIFWRQKVTKKIWNCAFTRVCVFWTLSASKVSKFNLNYFFLDEEMCLCTRTRTESVI